MEKKSVPLYYGSVLMPWAKAIVVKGAKGFVWLAGIYFIINAFYQLRESTSYRR